MSNEAFAWGKMDALLAAQARDTLDANAVRFQGRGSGLGAGAAAAGGGQPDSQRPKHIGNTVVPRMAP
ncbi:MAG: hypothetical protein JNJ71_10375 [Rubrivivax sp.]|nr:hypothetical protein [Rubrivivax sp.]